MIQQLINDEKFTNIQTAQAGLTRLFLDAQKTGTFYRVLKNDQPLGVLLSNDRWQSIVEDLEALSSPSYKIKITKARKEKNTIKSSVIKKQLGI